MDSDHQLFPRWKSPRASSEIFPYAEAAGLAGVTPRSVLKYWRLGLIQPLGNLQRFGIYFDLESVQLIRRTEEVRHTLNIAPEPAVVIVKQQMEILRLREELQFWRR